MEDCHEKPEYHPTLGEEIANSISHGVGALVALIGIPFLISAAISSSGPAKIIGVCIFAFTLLCLYVISTVYHALAHNRAKKVLQILDHSAIFLLIAGTYTPFLLGPLWGPWGWSLFAVIWTLACCGVVLKGVAGVRYPWISIVLYLMMGWLILVAVEPAINTIPSSALHWLIAGGICYSLGVVFFLLDERIRYCHFIWHLFVLAGSGCHFMAVLRGL